MFGLFKKDVLKKLNKEYDALTKKALDAQRNGKIELYGELTLKADTLLKEIEELEAKKK